MAEKKWTVWSYSMVDQEKRIGDDDTDVVSPAWQYSKHRDMALAERGAKNACKGGLMGGRNIVEIRSPEGEVLRQRWTMGTRSSERGQTISFRATAVHYNGKFIVKED